MMGYVSIFSPLPCSTACFGLRGSPATGSVVPELSSASISARQIRRAIWIEHTAKMASTYHNCELLQITSCHRPSSGLEGS